MPASSSLGAGISGHTAVLHPAAGSTRTTTSSWCHRTPTTTGSIAPTPTKAAIRMRTLLPYQFCRFSAVNLTMLELARRSYTPLTWGAVRSSVPQSHSPA